MCFKASTRCEEAGRVVVGLQAQHLKHGWSERRACVCSCERTILGVSETHCSPLRQSLSLAWGSAIILDFLVKNFRDPPVFVWVYQMWITTPSIFIYILRY